MDKFRLAEYSYEVGHHVGVSLRDGRILQIEQRNTCRKYKESAYMNHVLSPISQPALDVTTIWIPCHWKEVRKLHNSSNRYSLSCTIS